MTMTKTLGALLVVSLPAIAAAGIAVAAPASATPESYLNDLRNHGIAVYNVPGALNDGYTACNELGTTPLAAVVDDLQGRNPTLNRRDADLTVRAALHNLCPDKL